MWQERINNFLVRFFILLFNMIKKINNITLTNYIFRKLIKYLNSLNCFFFFTRSRKSLGKPLLPKKSILYIRKFFCKIRIFLLNVSPRCKDFIIYFRIFIFFILFFFLIIFIFFLIIISFFTSIAIFIIIFSVFIFILFIWQIVRLIIFFLYIIISRQTR